jgi:di/tricarboxylate transporter
MREIHILQSSETTFLFLLIYSILIDMLVFILGRTDDTPGKSCPITISLLRILDNKTNTFSPSVP